MPFTYEYPRPMVTVDTVVLTRVGRTLEVALIERGHDPFKGEWALPGGFIEMDEELDVAAKRELEEETGICAKWLRPGCFIGTLGRDPRGRTISGVFYTLFADKPDAKAGDDAANLKWCALDQLPRMCFDHRESLNQVIEQVEKDALTSGLVFQAIQPAFSVDEFAEACAAMPGLAFLEPQAMQVVFALVGRGLVSRIDTPPNETPLFRWNRKTWGEKSVPWTGWFAGQ